MLLVRLVGYGWIAYGEGEGLAKLLDGDRRSIELGEGEAFEFLTGVVVALVGKDAQGYRLTELHSPFVVRPPMNPRELRA